jgi:hypothetical protein
LETDCTFAYHDHKMRKRMLEAKDKGL